MPPIPFDAETALVARRLVWFEPPEKALAQPGRFLAYAFARASASDMAVIRRHVSEDDLRQALRDAPPGIIDARSWAYWHLMLDLAIVPEPTRRF
ncbi:MAG: hypothetical protein IT478_04395, partial [Xanthomonadales bacterium]|nr:hypothetical protein [Xanthomonadales bacterium]